MKTAITLRDIKFNVEDVSKITEFRKIGIRGETIHRQYHCRRLNYHKPQIKEWGGMKKIIVSLSCIV